MTDDYSMQPQPKDEQEDAPWCVPAKWHQINAASTESALQPGKVMKVKFDNPDTPWGRQCDLWDEQGLTAWSFLDTTSCRKSAVPCKKQIKPIRD